MKLLSIFVNFAMEFRKGSSSQQQF